jgi:hypothetical protein
MAEQKLDLLQLASGIVTQTRTGPAKVVGREFRQPNLSGIFLHDMPDNLLCHTVAPGSSRSANTQKQFSTRNSGCIRAFIDSFHDPVWDRNSSDVAPLANQIDYCPMAFATLKVIDSQVSKFTAPKAAT